MYGHRCITGKKFFTFILFYFTFFPPAIISYGSIKVAALTGPIKLVVRRLSWKRWYMAYRFVALFCLVFCRWWLSPECIRRRACVCRTWVDNKINIKANIERLRLPAVIEKCQYGSKCVKVLGIVLFSPNRNVCRI